MSSFLQLLIEQDTRLSKKSRDEQEGPCPNPNCGRKTNGFTYADSKNAGRGGFMCRGCWDSGEYLSEETARAIGKLHKIGEKRGWGDSIDYLRHIRGMKFAEAKAYRDEHDTDTTGTTLTSHTRGTTRYGQPPDAAYQSRAKAYTEEAINRLWNMPEGQAALAYYRARGLADPIIKNAMLGSDRDYRGIECVVIPWYARAGGYWKVSVRAIDPNIPPEKRYKALTDSSNSGLYLSDCLTRKKPTLLVEGEFDALIAVQEAGDLVNVVSLAGKDGSNATKWVVELALQPLVLVALDNDAQSESKAQEWCKYLSENAIRYAPLAKDINEMHLAGLSVREWVESALAMFADDQQGENATQSAAADAHELPELTYDEIHALPEYKASEARWLAERENDIAEARAAAAREDLEQQQLEESEEYKRLIRFGEIISKVNDALGGDCVIERVDSMPDYIRQQSGASYRQGMRRISSIEYTQEEQAILQHLLKWYDARLTILPCPTCGCRIEVNSLGSYDCANCDPAGGWSSPLCERIAETAYTMRRELMQE